MTIIIIGLLVWLLGAVVICISLNYWEDRFPPLMLWLLFGGLGIGGTSTIIIQSTTGLYPGYSQGVREGYLVKISEKGMIFKTWEGQIQIGTGQQAALQEPFSFSIAKTRKDLYEFVQTNLSAKVRIEYSEWICMPWRIGESGYEVISITLQ